MIRIPMRFAPLFAAAWSFPGGSSTPVSTLPVGFVHVPGHNCVSVDTPAAAGLRGSGLRDFAGTAVECKAKCAGLGPTGCSGFVRVLRL